MYTFDAHARLCSCYGNSCPGFGCVRLFDVAALNSHSLTWSLVKWWSGYARLERAHVLYYNVLKHFGPQGSDW